MSDMHIAIENLKRGGPRKQLSLAEWQALALLDDSQMTVKLMHVMGIESHAELRGFRKGFAIGLRCSGKDNN